MLEEIVNIQVALAKLNSNYTPRQYTEKNSKKENIQIPGIGLRTVSSYLIRNISVKKLSNNNCGMEQQRTPVWYWNGMQRMTVTGFIFIRRIEKKKH